MSETLENAEGSGKRPSFITVLCILTFIGAGLGLLGGLYNAFTISSQIAAIESLSSGFGDLLGDEINNQIKALKEYGTISAWLQVVANALCLFGAIKMWGLAKQGFFIYVGGQVIGLVGVFLIMGTSFLAGPVAMIFPIAFIVMYGVNLKHLK